MKTYFPDDGRILELAPRANKGDAMALRELRAIYERGEFDPGFGRELNALLAVSEDDLLAHLRKGDNDGLA